jgi:hypothetical protein
MRKKIFLVIVISFLVNQCFSQQANRKNQADSSRPFYEAEASCGSCKLNMNGKGCFLAIRLNEKNYFVQGAGIDDFGDAHDKEGFCNAIRKVTIQGEIKEDHFILSYIKFNK